MDFRYGIKVNAPIQPGEAVKILILTPAAGCPFKHLHRQFVLSVFHIRCQFKFGRCKSILTVSDEVSIKPDCQTALRALKRDVKRFVLHLLRYFKIFHITCHRIKSLRDLPRHDRLTPVPRILHIHILRGIISFHLYMSRNTDVIPAVAVHSGLFKPFYRLFIVFRVMEFPDPIQGIAITALFFLRFLPGRVCHMIRMRIHAVIHKIFRIFYFFITKFTHIFSYLHLFLF